MTSEVQGSRDQSVSGVQDRVRKELKELNRRYLLLVRELHHVSPAEVTVRTGLSGDVCGQIAGLTLEQIDELANPDVLSLQDRHGSRYWERAIQDLQDPHRLAIRQSQAVLLCAEGR